MYPSFGVLQALFEQYPHIPKVNVSFAAETEKKKIPFVIGTETQTSIMSSNPTAANIVPGVGGLNIIEERKVVVRVRELRC